MCHGHLVTRSVTWRHHRTDVQTSQSGTTRSVEECSWRFLHRLKTERHPTVGKVYVKCSANLLEASWSIVNSSRSYIKNWLNTNSDLFWCCSEIQFGVHLPCRLYRLSATAEREMIVRETYQVLSACCRLWLPLTLWHLHPPPPPPVQSETWVTLSHHSHMNGNLYRIFAQVAAGANIIRLVLFSRLQQAKSFGCFPHILPLVLCRWGHRA